MGLFLPGDVGDAGEVVDVAGKDEEVVTEAIDVVEDYGLDVGTGVGEGEDFALGTSAYGSRHMGMGCSNATPGQDELTQLRDCEVEGVDSIFKFHYVSR